MRQDDEIVISIIDVFAYLVKKFIIIAVCSFIALALGIGIHYLSANSESSLKKYTKNYSDYEARLSGVSFQLNTMINSRSILEKQKLEDPSILFNDGRQITKTTILLSLRYVSDDKNSTNAVNSMTSAIKTFISTIDLASLINSSIDNEYLRPLVDFSGTDGFYSIAVYTDNSVVPDSLPSEIMKSLESFISNRVDFELVEISSTSGLYNGSYFSLMVEEYTNQISTLSDDIILKTEEMEQLEHNPPSRFHFLRFGVLGFLIGGVISVLALVISFIVRDPLTVSFEVENIIKLPFLGAFFSGNGPFDKLARRIIKERRFDNDEMAIKFFQNSINVLSNERLKNIVVISSLTGKGGVEKASSTVCNKLSVFGCDAVFVANALNNPETVSHLNDADAVIFVEKQWKSSWKIVNAQKALAARFNKPVIGFVLV